MQKNITYLLTGLILVLGILQPLASNRVYAAIDAPRGVVVEGGDTQYEMRFWWINPNSANLDHVNIYYSRLQLTNFGVLATNNEVVSNEVSNIVTPNIDIDTDYYFYLTATDKEGNESEPTTILKRRTGISADVTSTIPVGNVSTNDIVHNSITLNWTNPSEDDFYKTLIYRSTESSVVINEANLITQSIALPSTVQTYTNTNLEPETTYYYRLLTNDTKGNTSDSVIVSATTLSASIEPEVTPPEDEVEEPIIDDNEIVPTIMPNPALFDYRASWVSQNGVVNDANTAHVITATAGETITLELTLKNTGSAWWYFESPDNAHEVKIGTWNATDRISPFQANNWLSSNRVSMLDTMVPTGETVTFSFNLTIPADTAPGTYSEYFRLVAEYVEWFGPAGIFWNIEVV